jgi:hypothetical protein
MDTSNLVWYGAPIRGTKTLKKSQIKSFLDVQLQVLDTAFKDTNIIQKPLVHMLFY